MKAKHNDQKPKKAVDPDDVLTPQEARVVRRGLAQLKRGDSSTLAEVLKRIDAASKRGGRSKLTGREIEEEITAYRKEKRQSRSPLKIRKPNF
jgi:hypothetical protein